MLKREGFSGVLALTLPEALWLVGTDVTDDVLVGYPTADRGALFRLVQDEQLAATVTIMVDDVAQLDLIDAVSPPHRRETVRVCIELDCSWRPANGPLRIGARRSPLRTPESLGQLATIVTERAGFRLVGIMAYESQIAGVPDQFPGRTTYGQIVRWMKRRSARELLKRRAAAVEAVRTVADIEFVNGGGTGSLDRTAGEDVITEVAAGSGLPRRGCSTATAVSARSPRRSLRSRWFAAPPLRSSRSWAAVMSRAVRPGRTGCPSRGFGGFAPRSGRRRRRSADPATWSGRGRAGHRRLGVVPARQGRRARGTVRAHVSGPR